MPLDPLEEIPDEEAAERRILVNCPVGRVFVGLAVVAVVIFERSHGGRRTAIWHRTRDDEMNFANGLTRRRDKIILSAQDCRWMRHRSWVFASLVGG